LVKYFDKYTGALGANEKNFSLEDLKAFQSLEDAKAHLVASKVEAIMRQSFEEWTVVLKGRWVGNGGVAG
jgi:hypothetical protein